MIENANQYNVTKKRLAEFKDALVSINAVIEQEDKIIDLITHAQRDAVVSMIEELESLISEYESRLEPCIIIPFPNKSG